jgi:hypothetical protein
LEEDAKEKNRQSAATRHKNARKDTRVANEESIEADQNRAQEKMMSDERLMQVKIQADKERYEEKIKSDYVDANVNKSGGDGATV